MKNIIFVICVLFISVFSACTKIEEQSEVPQTAPSHQFHLKSGEDDDLPIVNEQTRKMNGAVAPNVTVLFIDDNQDTTSQITNDSGYAQLILPHTGVYDFYLKSPLYQSVHEIITIMDSITNRTDSLEYQ